MSTRIPSAVSTARRVSKTRWLLAALVAIGSAGCGTTGDDVSADPGALITTGHCSVTATGVTAVGEGVDGSIVDMSGIPGGSWQNSGAGTLDGTPDWLECRVNGSTVADFTGSGTWNGAPGYTFRVHVQDRGTPGEPIRVEGAPGVDTVTATRTYSPSQWTDGTDAFEAGAYVTVPSALPVTVGNAGNQWAWVTFAPDPGGAASLTYPVRCRYRGGAHNPNPTSPADVAAGLSYTFVDCQRPCDDVDTDADVDEHERHEREHGGDRHGGHLYSRADDRHSCHGDDDDGEQDTWCTDPAILAGAQLEVSSAVIHVQSGSSRYPTRRDAQTTVSVDLAVQAFTLSTPENDFYRLAVWDSGGNLVHSSDGDLASGNITVTLLP